MASVINYSVTARSYKCVMKRKTAIAGALVAVGTLGAIGWATFSPMSDDLQTDWPVRGTVGADGSLKIALLDAAKSNCEWKSRRSSTWTGSKYDACLATEAN